MITETTKSAAEILADILATVGIKNELPSQTETIEQTEKVENLTVLEWLNKFVWLGVSFQVSADTFTVCGYELLTDGEKEYIEENRSALLCTMQQGFLQRDIFRHSKEILEDFRFAVFEREALILADGGEFTEAIHFQAVCEVSRLWFIKTFQNVEGK